MVVTAEDFWLFQGLSERADVTEECFVINFSWVYFVPRVSFCVPFGNRKLKTSQLPAYVAEVSVERLGLYQWLYIVSIIYNFYLQVHLEWAQLFWSEWVQATSQEMLYEVWGNRAFLTSIWKWCCTEVSNSCKDLHLLNCTSYCLWLAPFKELWKLFAVGCPWLCCPVKEVVRAMCTTVLRTIKLY